MRTTKIFMQASLFLLLVAAASCKSEPENKAIDLANMDTTVDPGADFDSYANGGWKANNPLPADKSRFGTFDMLRDTAEKQLQTLFTTITTSEQQTGSVGQKIATMYNLGMDSIAIEAQGYEPLKPYLAQIEAIKTADEVQAYLIESFVSGNGSLFGFGSGTDDKNSSWVIAQLYQGGLGLSDRDYYVNTDPRSVEIRGEYVKHVVKMLELTEVSADVAAKKAQQIMALETRLAQASMTRLDRRDPEKTYNKMDLKGVETLAPNFKWQAFFSAMNLSNPGEINVGMPNFFREMSLMLKDVPVESWKAYLAWNEINAAAPYLSSTFVDTDFAFYGKVMKGQEENRARWKRVQGTVNSVLSEAIGQLYVAEYFPPQAKERMVNLVENLRVSLGERIQNLDWMSEETKVKGLEKLNTINVKIGYPDKWRDYTALNISNDSYYENVRRSRKFDSDFDLTKINKSVDKAEWYMPPQMVNAYYNPSMNEIVFPAAILQPPFFFLDADDAVNYGAIGVVIGHEMTHGFDDQGCKFDKDGNLNNWWTEDDSKRFGERTQILVDEFNQYEVLDTLKADGQLTLGENIADLGGLNISYQAFKKAGKATQPIAGFTSDQRFFLSYAHIWASNVRDKEIQRLTKEDVHSLGRFRVLGPLRNMPEFHAAFNIKEGDFMFLAESKRAVIW